MSKFADTLKKRHDEQEQRRVGDIYDECTRRGCDIEFVKSFEARLWLYPLKQTHSFFEAIDRYPDDERRIELLRQWAVLLETARDKRPSHEKVNEWEKALSEISSYQENKGHRR